MARTALQEEIRMSVPFASLAVEAAGGVQRTAQHLTAWADRELAPHDLRIEEYNVLRILRGAGPAGHPRADIGERMVHDPDRLLALLHRLKGRGLVAGVLRVTITAEGLALLAAVDGGIERAFQQKIGWIDPARVRAAIEVLELIRGGPVGAEG